MTSDASPSHSDAQNLSMSAALRATRDQDRRKGIAISHQLSVWNALLDARIQLQKAISATNSLPSSSDAHALPSDSIESVVQEAFELSRELLALQSNLYQADALEIDTHSHPQTTDDANDSLRKWSSTISEAEGAHAPHLTRTLSKWSAKVHTAAPNFASSMKSSTSKASLGQAPGVVHAIQDVLEADSEALLMRTTTLPANEHGASQTDRDVFNDTEFYQQLLRDVIHSKVAANGDEEQVWLQRQAKAKRNKTVDTKASKGRKIRYEVHEKLQHFMIPIPVVVGGWPDEQIDELFSSLVGS